MSDYGTLIMIYFQGLWEILNIPIFDEIVNGQHIVISPINIMLFGIVATLLIKILSALLDLK